MRSLRLLGVVVLLAAGCTRERGAALPFGADDASCAGCHAQADDFARSAHASAATSPVFLALLPRVEGAWGIDARERCVGCHAPAHVPEEDRRGEVEGLGCVSCHAAVGNRGTFDGRLIVDLGAPLDGPFADPEETPAHASAHRGFVSHADSCLTCHDLRGPELFVEPTAMEHAEAVATVDAPSCASCHMPALEEAEIADGASRIRPRRSHRFVGPTPPADDDEGSWASYVAELRALFSGRVTLTLRRDGEQLVVHLINAGMGHALPTGVTFLRELHVEVTIEGDELRTVTPIELGDRPMRGEAPVVLPTDADRLERRRLDPGEGREVSVPLAPGDVRAEARLVFGAYRADVVEALGVPGSLARQAVVLDARIEL